jgi:signal transduction histidine kinase/CheY-like chemotaxis protein
MGRWGYFTHGARGYAAGLTFAALAAGAAYALNHWGADPGTAYLFVIPAIAASAIAFGRGPATAVLIVGALTANLPWHPGGVAGLCGYLLVGVALVLAGSALRQRLERSAVGEEQLRLAQDGTGVGVYQLDFATNTAFASPSLCRLLGQPVMQAPIPLDQWFAALDPAHVSQAKRTIEAHIERGELRYQVDQRVATTDGSIRWLQTQVQLGLSPAKTLASACGATVDITERMLLLDAQRKLQQQVEDLRRLNMLSNELAAADGDLAEPLGELLAAVLEFHGAKRGFLTVKQHDARGFVLLARRGLADGHEPCVPDTADDDDDIDAVLEAHHAFGAAVGCPQLHCTPMLMADGGVGGVFAVAIEDASAVADRALELGRLCAVMASAAIERGRARRREAEQGRRFGVVLEASIVPFNLLAPIRDAGGRIVDLRWTYLNSAAARLWGRDKDDLVGRAVTEILPRNWEMPGLLERFVAIIDGGESCEFETQSPSRPEVWLHVIGSPLPGLAAVWFSDISERKRQDRAREEADRRKDEFLATLAHELRNPLAPIRQSIRIARHADVGRDRIEWAHSVIERQVRHMALLLDDLLDVSRITRGNLLLRKSRVPLANIIETAMEVARPLIDAQGHQCELTMPDGDIWVEVDPLRMAQVVGNLLTNAAKYTDPGGRLSVSAAQRGGEILIRIKDTGIGFTREQCATMFDMFSQAPAALRRSKGGLGIGLALSRNLARLHGGDVEAFSLGPGHGSEFMVRFPRGEPDPRSSDAHPQLAPRGSARRRLLVADDNADAADTLAALLQLEGHEVYVAYDGREALEQFQRHAPEAAFLDVGMPMMSGYEVARAIRDLPTGQGVVMVAVTGWGQTGDRDAAFDAGFDHHITKPVDPNKILALID